MVDWWTRRRGLYLACIYYVLYITKRCLYRLLQIHLQSIRYFQNFLDFCSLKLSTRTIKEWMSVRPSWSCLRRAKISNLGERRRKKKIQNRNLKPTKQQQTRVDSWQLTRHSTRNQSFSFIHSLFNSNSFESIYPCIHTSIHPNINKSKHPNVLYCTALH